MTGGKSAVVLFNCFGYNYFPFYTYSFAKVMTCLKDILEGSRSGQLVYKINNVQPSPDGNVNTFSRVIFLHIDAKPVTAVILSCYHSTGFLLSTTAAFSPRHKAQTNEKIPRI